MAPPDAESDTPKTARVGAPPPLIYLFFFGAGLLIQSHVPLPILPDEISSLVGWPFIVVAIVLMGLAVSAQRRMHTSINPYKPTTALVTAGVYSWSRNPIYLADAVLYIGVCLVLNALIPLLLLPIVMLIIRWVVIWREERYLEAKFGDEYRAYKGRVGRWFSLW